jgi:hypothetical protein
MHLLASPLTRWLQDFLRKWLISRQQWFYGIQEVTGSIPVSSTTLILATESGCQQPLSSNHLFETDIK